VRRNNIFARANVLKIRNAMNEIKSYVQKLTNNGNTSVESFLAKVIEVHRENRLCDVQPLEGAELFDVRICAIQLKQTNGFWIVPKIGSHVVVTMLGANSGFVSMFSEVDEIYLQTSETDNGGLIIRKELKTEIDKINTFLNTIRTVFNSFVPVPSDGGAALKTAMVSAIQNLQLANIGTNIENEKVKH